MKLGEPENVHHVSCLGVSPKTHEAKQACGDGIIPPEPSRKGCNFRRIGDFYCQENHLTYFAQGRPSTLCCLSRPGKMMTCQVGRACSCSPPRWLNMSQRRTANKQTTRLLHRRDMCQPDSQDRRKDRACSCSLPCWLSTCLRRTENKHTTSPPQCDMRQRGTRRGRSSQGRNMVSKAGR